MPRTVSQSDAIKGIFEDLKVREGHKQILRYVIQNGNESHGCVSLHDIVSENYTGLKYGEAIHFLNQAAHAGILEQFEAYEKKDTKERGDKVYVQAERGAAVYRATPSMREDLIKLLEI